ncbi:MAG: PQQ-binding-like beta-propeller repeat protein, partial [Armatimonadota bacterium]
MRSTAPMAGLLSLMAAWAFAAVSPAASADRYDALAARIIQTTGVKGGLVVHLGCGDGRLTAALHMNDRYVVHGLDSDAGNVEKARAHIRSLGLYGEVCVQQWQEAHLPYADNLINLVVWEKPGEVTMREVRRVLAPGGVAYIRLPGRWTKSVKPRPHDIDEWTHHLHGPDGNPVANDSVVGRPRRYQWVAGPLWLRSHDTDSSVDAVVTAGGRIFYIIDEGPISLPGDHPLPDKWRLVARDAFNGVLLWKVPIPQWGWRQWKDSWFANRPDNLPVNLPRRLVAVGDKVYVTLGYHAPVSQLDAATGKLLQTYEGTHDTREILLCEGVLILSVYTNGRLKVVAVNADTGRRLWQSKGTYAGSAREYFPYWRDSRDTKVDPALNPAADGKVVCIIDGRDIVCLDFHTGDELWRQKVEQKESASSVGSLLVRDGVVVHGKRNELVALSASTGKRLWSHPKREFGWLWFQWKDVFVIGGLVWTWSADVGQETFEWRGKPYRARWPVSVNGYDLHTGELKKQVHVGNIFKAPHHHRCYRNKATVRYVIASRRGSEFVDLLTGKHTVDNWVRGTCHLGMMPANGLLYAPPHPCVCYANEKLNGFMALAPGPQFDEGLGGPTAAPRLERGPAYGRVEQGGPTTGADDDWPTYRHDAMRSGATRAAVPDRLTHRWSVRVGDRLSPPTVGGERLFVSSIDEHRVAALSVEDGKTLWEFTASARVDTPPTLYLGTVLFGSADGWVYCLRASDGRIVWRFRAAPDDRLIGAFGQIESAWPVHGSVLVQDGLAYVVAGRSSHLDGGIWLYALDARTGRLVHQARLRGPQTNFDSFEHNFNPPQGALSDVLQGDGQRVYMRNLAFDPSLNEEAGDGDRITTVGGFLDDTYFKRAPWRFGRGSNWGRLISYDEDCVYVVRMFDTLQCLVPDNYFTPGKRGYEVAARPRRQFSQVSVANSDSLNPAG